MADTIAGGFDTEDLEVWRARVLERYYWTPQGGADGDYVVWAKEVPGVTRAWTYRHWMGTGTVGVMIASSDLINPILDDATVAAVQAHIEPLAPVAGSDLYVLMGRLIKGGMDRKQVAIIYDVGVSTLYKKFPVGGS
jgi:uncharacterized phage protein gp47/JayE